MNEETFFTFGMMLPLCVMAFVFWYGLLTSNFVVSIATILINAAGMMFFRLLLNVIAWFEISISTDTKDGIFTCSLIAAFLLSYGIYYLFIKDDDSKLLKGEKNG